MPVELNFEEPSLFTIRACGAVIYDEARRTLDELLMEDSRLRGGASIFVDNRGVTSIPSVAELGVIIRQFATVFRRGARRVALLAESESVYRACRLFASFASTVGGDAKVFRDAQKAVDWLGIDRGPGARLPVGDPAHR